MRAYTQKFVRRHWPGVSRELVEDAVGEGLLRTMEMWVHWKGSVVAGDPDLTMRGAKRHACMTAHKYIRLDLERDKPTTSDEPVVLLDRVLQNRAAAAIAELQEDEREWDTWARDFLEGKSEREVAEEQGVNHSAIHRRRQRGMNRIRPMLKRHGLEGGTT